MCKCGCNKCETEKPMLMLNENKASRSILSEGLKRHIDTNRPLTEQIYRKGSRDYFNLISEARYLYSRGILEFTNKEDLHLLTETNLGHFGIYKIINLRDETINEIKVPLDFPMLNEASGSWLTKSIYDALVKELNRTSPQLSKNEYYSKAFSVYLHDLDSIAYSELGQNRFKHLDTAWDYIEKNTEALSSTNDKLNRRHIRSMLDGPVYAMLKGDRYNLENTKQDKLNESYDFSWDRNDIYDEIAQSEFEMDYDQLGSNEQEWVRDEYDNQSSDRHLNEKENNLLKESYKMYVKGDKVGYVKKLNFKNKKALNNYINKK